MACRESRNVPQELPELVQCGCTEEPMPSGLLLSHSKSLLFPSGDIQPAAPASLGIECTGGSHDHNCCCWRERAWVCLGMKSCSVLRCQSTAEAAPSSRELATGLFWAFKVRNKGVLLFENTQSFKGHNSAFKTSLWELQLILLQHCIYLSHRLITSWYPPGVGFLLACQCLK